MKNLDLSPKQHHEPAYPVQFQLHSIQPICHLLTDKGTKTILIKTEDPQ